MIDHPHSKKLPRRTLGSTGLETSVLGLGTVKWGRNQGVKYPAFELPDDATLHHLLDVAEAAGINLIDTAPAYGIAEERVGRILSERRSGEWIIVTKVGEEFLNGMSRYDFSADAMQASVDRSLHRLARDTLDVVLIHSGADDSSVLQQTSVLETLKSLQASGKIRSIGLSTMTVPGGLAAVEEMDVVMVPFSVGYRDHLPVIQRAAALKKGVMIKRALYSGPYAEQKLPLRDHFLPVLQCDGVASLVAGTINPRHLQENIDAVLDLAPARDS